MQDVLHAIRFDDGVLSSREEIGREYERLTRASLALIVVSERNKSF